MDYRSFDKNKLIANVAAGVICYFMFAYELYYSFMNSASWAGALIFLFLAVNCTYRVYSYYKLQRIKKDSSKDYMILEIERRQNILISIFSNATAVLCLLAFIALIIVNGGSTVLAVFCAVFAIFFAFILFQNIKNLNRLDRL